MSQKPIAFVTGGNRGIGLAIAKTLLQDGFQVVIGSRSGASVPGFDCVAIDVTSTRSVDDAFTLI